MVNLQSIYHRFFRFWQLVIYCLKHEKAMKFDSNKKRISTFHTFWFRRGVICLKFSYQTLHVLDRKYATQVNSSDFKNIIKWNVFFKTVRTAFPHLFPYFFFPTHLLITIIKKNNTAFMIYRNATIKHAFEKSNNIIYPRTSTKNVR